jgi:hypothetical protein
MARSRLLTVEGARGVASYDRQGFVTVTVTSGGSRTSNAWRGAGRYRKAARFAQRLKDDAAKECEADRFFARIRAAEMALDD